MKAETEMKDKSYEKKQMMFCDTNSSRQNSENY